MFTVDRMKILNCWQGPDGKVVIIT